MAVSTCKGGISVQYPARPSVIQSATFCCFNQQTALNHQNKRNHDAQSTHQNYMKLEQENVCLNLQFDNFDNMLKDQNY